MSTPEHFVQQVRRALEPVADPVRATPMARYMRGQFSFLGIPQPLHTAQLRPILAQTPPEETWVLEAARQVWALEAREYQYAALSLLRVREKVLSPSAVPTLERLVLEKSWWDTVDPLASRVFGGLVRRFPEVRTATDAYSTHSNFWLRRVALLYQLGHRRATDSQRLFAYCLESTSHPEFFVQKAIGWALREYAKTDPRAVRAFVEAHRDRLAALSVREALKHLERAGKESPGTPAAPWP